jgi:hypothetical protein
LEDPEETTTSSIIDFQIWMHHCKIHIRPLHPTTTLASFTAKQQDWWRQHPPMKEGEGCGRLSLMI